MRYSGTIEVAATREEAYGFLTDPHRVTAIFPDVSDLKVEDENNFTMKVKAGVSFIKGTMNVRMNVKEKRMPEVAKLTASGTGMNSSINLESEFVLKSAQGGGTVVEWSAEAKVGGMIASVGARMIDSVAEKYIQQMVGSLRKELAGQQPKA